MHRRTIPFGDNLTRKSLEQAETYKWTLPSFRKPHS